MQENAEDFYESCEGGDESGCCLKCSTSYPGCLCFNCKCKKCYWYNLEECHCDLVPILKEEGKKKKIREIKIWELKKYKEGQLLKQDNEKKAKKLNSAGIIVSEYTCQGCNRILVHPKEIIIILGKEPLCKICSGKIFVKKEDVEDELINN